MKYYEIVYYKEAATAPTSEETDCFAVFEVNKNHTKMRAYLNCVEGKITIYKNEDWFEYRSNGYEKDITEEDIFLLNV